MAAAFAGQRDERLIAALCRLHEERGHEDIEVAVVYGAGHTAAVVAGLRKRYGYRPRSADWLTIADLCRPRSRDLRFPRDGLALLDEAMSFDVRPQ
ncbi:hypothetical protein AB0J74_17875 [Asanoa sp. NPDC049573]|uniref:hypothetical protein n=1 Tax=Asanoa sp. NPDC049573 TaxID=3155396 RepID=UPI00343FC662